MANDYSNIGLDINSEDDFLNFVESHSELVEFYQSDYSPFATIEEIYKGFQGLLNHIFKEA